MSPPLLAAEGLALARNGRPVLQGLDLLLEAGQRKAVVGRSGAGKTTLLRLLAGLDAPEDGRILLDGEEASLPGRIRIPPWERGLQMVFQDLGLWPGRSVRAHVEIPLRAAGLERGEARRRAAEILERLGLGSRAGERVGRLSGGEARRVAFARALAPGPRLLLLDEPFASLDPVARAHGLELLEEVLASTRAAVLLVTHEPEEARALAGGCAVLRDGRLEEAGPAAEVCRDAETFRRILA